MRSNGRPKATIPPTGPRPFIVVQAFARNQEDGQLFSAAEPRHFANEGRAVSCAEELARRYAGVVAWRRDDDADGSHGEPTIFFTRGELPDLEMPVRRPAGPDDEAPSPSSHAGKDGDEPTWMGMQLPAASAWQPFHLAFQKLYLSHPNPDLLAVFTAFENRRIVVLPPEAARLVQRELPAYRLRACGRPPSSMVCLELGHRLQMDTTWFSVSDDERAQRRLATNSAESPAT